MVNTGSVKVASPKRPIDGRTVLTSNPLRAGQIGKFNILRAAVVSSIFEMVVVFYYLVSIILVSFVFGQHYGPTNVNRQYWLTLIAIRYFLVAVLLAFALILLIAIRINNDRLLLCCVIKSILAAATVVITIVCDAVVIVRRSESIESINSWDGFSYRFEYWYAMLDIGVNCVHGLGEFWFFAISHTLYRYFEEKTRKERFAKHLQHAVNLAAVAALKGHRRNLGALAAPPSSMISDSSHSTSRYSSLERLEYDKRNKAG